MTPWKQQAMGALGVFLVAVACNTTTTSGGGAPDGTGSGSGNASSGSGSGSTGGPSNNTTFDQIRQTKIGKLDVLFVVDNSIWMPHKHEFLAEAVPYLLDRLIVPNCVDEETGSSAPRDASGNCPAGYQREFDPLDDINLGVITSSLGAHGGQICSEEETTESAPDQNDRGLLLGSIRPNALLTSQDGMGFLAWSPTGSRPGERDADVLKTNLRNHVLAAGEDGCSYEAPLEAWYRFLVDPSPPLEISVEDGVAAPTRDANGNVIVDTKLLAQREAFLRPDSIVAIIMLTDENDCSIVDGGLGYLTSQPTLDGAAYEMPPASSACDADPNSPCCRSCGLNEASPPSGCDPLGEDENCSAGREQNTDPLNLRCFDQKRRFGMDLLYPTARYVDGLTQPQVYDTHNCAGGSCPLTQNPLFTSSSGSVRDPSLIVLAGIVGVPWQDVATQESLLGAGLEYKSAPLMLNDGTYAMILGDPATNTPPGDPLMIESTSARTGTHPVTGEPLVGAQSTDPQANSINGHEHEIPDRSDLQYACIFPLEEPWDCTNTDPCHCDEATLSSNLPICNPPGGGDASTTQYFTKAYPGLRHLQVLRDFGNNSVVASICPKQTSGDLSDPTYGYNPAISAIVRALEPMLRGRCLPKTLPVDDDGFASCRILEAFLSPGLDCDRPGRSAPSASDVQAALADLENWDLCRGSTCDDVVLCEIQQLEGAAHDSCLNSIEEPDSGFCYIDEEQGVGNPTLVDRCPDTQKRIIRFTGSDTPATGAVVLLACDE